MSDPLPTDPRPEALAGADREAKIEQLLLAGLDHYFDGQYDQAINIWTRALFLDRGHARARAYIERARSALAERQRESEELLQRGLAAFDRGASGEARRLLEAAITCGAPRDEALPVLDRIQRLDQPINVTGLVEDVPIEVLPEPKAHRRVTRRPTRGRWVLLTAAVAVGTVVLGSIVAGVVSFQIGWGRPQTTPPVGIGLAATPDDALPLPRRGERALGRARQLGQAGRLRDALATLDQVAITDEERPAADRLRAEIQRQLLAARTAAPAVSEAGLPAGPIP